MLSDTDSEDVTPEVPEISDEVIDAWVSDKGSCSEAVKPILAFLKTAFDVAFVMREECALSATQLYEKYNAIDNNGLDERSRKLSRRRWDARSLSKPGDKFSARVAHLLSKLPEREPNVSKPNTTERFQTKST